MHCGCRVILAGEGAQAALLAKEFPQLPCLPLRGYRIRYSRSRWMLPLRILSQVPSLLRSVKNEHAWLQDIIAEHHIDLVISDNRYGLYTHKVPCVFITHQLTIKAPYAWLERMLQHINYRYINRFSCCWVPDVPGEHNLAGELSHPSRLPSIPVSYIGLLSRLQPLHVQPCFAYCVLLSGPEPQRSILEEKILAGLQHMAEPVLLVRGLPAAGSSITAPPSVTVVNHLPSDELALAVQQSDCIVSRSGYTTVMEIMALGKKSLLIPTPGQTEQEYLAGRLHRNGQAFCVSQQAFDCARHLHQAGSLRITPLQWSVFDPAQMQRLLSSMAAAGR